MKKEYKLIIILLIITIISSNFIWYKLFTSEKEKLKHAIIPSLKDSAAILFPAAVYIPVPYLRNEVIAIFTDHKRKLSS